MSRNSEEPKFDEIEVKYLEDGKVAVVAFNKPKKMNSMTSENFAQLKSVMEYLGRVESEVRAIVLTGNGKNFSAGLDLKAAMEMNSMRAEPGNPDQDPARASLKFMHLTVRPFQESVSSLEHVRVPVIAALHGYVIGAGVDMSSACDIRFAAKNTQFTIKEVDIGLAADLGTLQRFQKVVGNDSWTRELSYTARFFTAQEALEKGFLSKVVDTQEECLQEAIKLATFIATKSPVAVTTTKQSLNYSRDHSVQEGLDHICWLNSVMLQTSDMEKAAMASFQKQKAVFPRL